MALKIKAPPVPKDGGELSRKYGIRVTVFQL